MFEPITVAHSERTNRHVRWHYKYTKKFLRQQSNSDYFFGNFIVHVNIW